jgi:heat shock protein HtpX
MKRIFLYVATNFAVLAVLSITMQLLGIDRMLAQETGLNLQGLLIMAGIFGFGGLSSRCSCPSGLPRWAREPT